MDWFSGKSNNKKVMNANVDVTPSTKVINNAGKPLANAVNSAKQVAGALKTVSAQLKSASRTLRKNASALADTAADYAQDPRVAALAEPIVGGANAAMLRNMPRSIVSGAARNGVNEAAKQLDNLSVAANDGANAIVNGVNEVAKGANWVAANAGKLPLDEINQVVNERANNVLAGGARNINAMVGGNVVPNVRLTSRLNSAHARAIASVARKVRDEASRKSERKGRKVARKSRKVARKSRNMW